MRLDIVAWVCYGLVVNPPNNPHNCQMLAALSIPNSPPVHSSQPPFTEEGELVAGIIANPRDDSPRLVYSDWLEERGELTKAARIREQVSMRSLLVTNRVPGFSMQAGAQLRAKWQRGFISELHCSYQWWLSNANRINWDPLSCCSCPATAHPLETVILTGLPELMSNLVGTDSLQIKLPELERTSTVSIKQMGGHQHVAIEVGVENILKATWPGIVFILRAFGWNRNPIRRTPAGTD